MGKPRKAPGITAHTNQQGGSVMDRRSCRQDPPRRSRRLLALALAAGVLTVAGAAGVRAAAGDAAASPSSCVACHTDTARLQEEAKGIPLPKGSALQAGKG